MSFWRGKKVLVTGGAGFIGSHLVEQLLIENANIRDTTKNSEVLFQAVQNLSQDIKILRVGKTTSNEAKNDPKRLAEKYGWSKNTIIVDQYIPEEEMIYYFSAADAIILSYVKDYPGTSINLLHGCQFALPVIASDVGQLRECVKTYKLGLTFVPEDSRSLQEAIVSFLNLDAEEKLAMKRNLQEFASAHSWDNMSGGTWTSTKLF